MRFSNSTHWDMFESRNCAKCIHAEAHGEEGCPLAAAAFLQAHCGGGELDEVMNVLMSGEKPSSIGTCHMRLTKEEVKG